MQQQLNTIQLLNPKSRFNAVNRKTGKLQHFLVTYLRKYSFNNELTIVETDHDYVVTGTPFKIFAKDLNNKYEISKFKAKATTWTREMFNNQFNAFAQLDPQVTYMKQAVTPKLEQFIINNHINRGMNALLRKVNNKNSTLLHEVVAEAYTLLDIKIC